MPTFLVTGAAGFIGYWLVRRLLDDGARVVGVDSLNNAYDPSLKEWRLGQLDGLSRFRFVRRDVTDADGMEEIFRGEAFEVVFHLAARAGAPQSVREAAEYIGTNAIGTQNLMDRCTDFGIGKFVLASTSSVYGSGNPLPLAEDGPANRPRSPYAASKRAAELLAHAHHHVHGLDVTVLRYFTVYGPAGRPDMSLFRFIRWIREGVPIVLHGDGTQSRDFTFVDDISRGTALGAAPVGYEVVNLGSDQPVQLRQALGIIEDCLGIRATIRREPVHRVDVAATWAAVAKARALLGWQPRVSLEAGIERMVRWYVDNRSWARNLVLPR